MSVSGEATRQVPLDALHRELGARMVPFAGYDMPLQYTGILDEHRQTREQAGLFDVSHMGQISLTGDDPVALIESLIPGDIASLPVGGMRYSMLTNADGGIIDDLMVTRHADRIDVVINAACKEGDVAHIRQALGDRGRVTVHDRALLALQGPAAAAVLGRLAPACAAMPFMTALEADLLGAPCGISRSGYTGEDGYEISIPADAAERIARHLLDQPEVRPIGLGARDSLRLEAGLCLYGSDIDESTTPIEAGLAWTIGKRRREAGGFPGAETILRQLAEGPPRRRVGLLPEGKAPARAHTPVLDSDGTTIGEITSGGFGPTVGGPVAMGYVRADRAAPDTAVNLTVRGRDLAARVVRMPFVAHRYYKGSGQTS